MESVGRMLSTPKMAIGVRTKDLRKVYSSPPPMAAGAAGFTMMGSRGPKQKKDFQIVALESLSLEVEPGEIVGLLGPNGAGKSTTLGILTTRVRPTGRQARIGDYDVWPEQVEAKRLLSVVHQHPHPAFAF